ncbi:MAG TPA: lysophospholipid acyltransferase family protein [Rhizomicrobium sp.]|nr:lysophospholipid acyltransferase family protein [Rhizomicrobium sp.]
MTLLRSLLFFVWFALVSAVLNIGFLPALLLPRAVVLTGCRWWCGLTLWGLKIFAGLDYEVRGKIPAHGALVAAKHMSMWDTVALFRLLDAPAVILKRELFSIPFYGWYVKKIGMIAIDRDGKASALRAMAAASREAMAEGRTLLIFPEGTRKKPGDAADYKPGVAALYGQLEKECVPVALNSGLFWTGFIKKPGTIVIEFLKPIAPGLKSRDFLAALQDSIETTTAGLLAAGRR